MNTKEILTAARKLLSNPDNWTQKAYARDYFGTNTPPTSVSACRWCSLGALRKVANRESDNTLAVSSLRDVVKCCVDEFNDSHTHAEVLALFDAAIEKA